MEEFLTATIIGLTTAGIFAIAASGLVLTYTTTGIFNFAHGAIGMLAAFSYWQLKDWGLESLPAALLILLVFAPLFGFFIESVVMRGLNDAPETSRLVVSVALLAACLALGLWVWPPDEARPLERFFPGEFVEILGVRMSWHSVLAFVLAVLVAGGLRFLLRSTRAGITMRAVVDDRGLTALNGARPDRSSMLAWALGCSLAALGGILLAPLQTLTHLPLTLLIVNAYAAALMGRLRSLPITFMGAVLLGLLDSYAFAYLPEDGWLEPWTRSLRPAIPALVLFVVLVALPTARLRTNAGMRRLAAPVPTWIGGMVLAVCVAGATVVMAAGMSDGDATKAGRAVALGIIGLSLVPLVGWAGQLCLCQMSFAAIGAITVANLGGGSNPAAIVVGMLIAALTGVLVALPAARLSGIELALATAAFAVILDRWVFATPDVEVLGWTISTFNRTNVTVDPLDLPVIGELTPRSLLVLLGIVFAAVHLLLVFVRRSGFGIRLLALRESPAACATLGLDPAATRLAVFAFSAALAALGGALYAGTLGSISPFNFDLFQSLPLLLVTVAGGVASTGGAIFAVIVLGGMPAIAARFASLAGLIGLLPGTMGITLGRNPDGVTTDLRNRLMPIWRSPVLLAVVGAVEVGLAFAWINESISGWGGLVVAFIVPFVVARAAERTNGPGLPVHALDGIESRRLTAADRAELDLALGLAEVPR